MVNNSQTVYEGFLIDLLDEIKRLLGDKLPPFELQETPAASLGLIEQFEDDIDRDSPTLTGLLREIQDSVSFGLNCGQQSRLIGLISGDERLCTGTDGHHRKSGNDC